MVEIDQFGLVVWGRRNTGGPVCGAPTLLRGGYSGSGPAQLALAILSDYLQDDKETIRLHQNFPQSIIDRKKNFPGGGDLADYLIFAGYTQRF